MESEQEIVIIGDRLLIAPDEGRERTTGGLYLPQGVSTKEKVQTGYVIKTGPGYIIPQVGESDQPWSNSGEGPKYIPLQVREGDFAMFIRRESIEVEYDNKKYLIVPHAAILAVVRQHFPT